MTKQKLTKSVVDRLSFADKGSQLDYWDSDMKGFGVRVSAISKTYFVMKRVNGKLTRITLGKHGIITSDEARKSAINALADLNKGIDVNREKSRKRDRSNTIGAMLDDYFLARQELKPRTVTTYKDLFRLYLSDWMNKPIGEITKDMVAARHLKIAKKAGKAAANNTMRTFRAVYNFANESMDDALPVNPVKRLSNTRQWYKVERRQTVIQEHDLPAWFDAVNRLDNPVIRDYLQLLLFTGARRTETASIAWTDVDMENRVFILTRTKNGKPLPLPMSDFIYGIFQSRLALRENDFVFPGNGKTGHLIEPRKQMSKVTKESGVNFNVHDMRRSYASAIDGVVGVYELKRLLNHAAQGSDVTSGYVVKSVDKLREPMQRVTELLMLATRAWCHYTPDNPKQQPEAEKVISLEERRKRNAA
jgi:integrase